ncbi:MAG: hypothetical protein GAK34_01619 [Delftia tsuruhatensis]|nr:MAG: hypothetical protein GAK34_01619 [Delftia tsuruhatensis]
MAGQVGHPAQFPGIAQPLCRGRALHPHLDGRFGGADEDAAVQHAAVLATDVALIEDRARVAQLHADLVAQRGIGRGEAGGRELVAHGQRLDGLGGLAQRSRQVDAHALQAGLDLDFGRATAHLQQQGIGRLALGMAGQVGHPAQFPGIAQPLCRGRALHPHLDGRFGGWRIARQRLHAAIGTQLTAQGPRLQADQREAGVGEFDGATQLAQVRCLVIELQRVARQRDQPGHLAAVQVVDGQLQLQGQLRGARGLAAVQHVPGQRRQGRGLDHPQHVGQRALALGGDGHLGVGQVGNAGLDVAHLQLRIAGELAARIAHGHGGAVKHQLAGQIDQGRPGRLAMREQMGRHIFIVHVMQLGRDVELALAGLVGGYVVQVAAHLEVHRARAPGVYGLAHIVARVGGNLQRQVAVHARAVGVAQLALQVQHAGKARLPVAAVAGMPLRAGLAFGVVIGKAQAGHLHADGLAAQLPAQAGLQAVQRDLGLLEHAGERQRRRPLLCALHLQLGLAAVLVQREARVQALEAGHARRRGAFGRCHAVDRQLLQFATGLVLLQGLQRAAPASLELVQAAGRCQIGQVLLHLLWKRQALAQLGEDGQVNAIGLELAVLTQRPLRAGAGGVVARAQIASRPVQAVARGKFQVLRSEAPAVLVLHAQPARQGLQLQRLQVFAPLQLQRVHGHVGHGAHGLALAQVYPGAQRAPALLQAQARGVYVLAELGQVDPREHRMGLAAPAAPVALVRGQQRLAEQAGQHEALAPAFGRRGIQAQSVAPALVAQHQVHIAQGQRRSLAQFVQPQQAAAAQRQFGLRKQPVGGGIVPAGRRADLDAGHEDSAIGRAAHHEFRTVYVDLFHAQAHQRACRNGDHHAGQAQGVCRMFGVLHHHVAQLEAGDQSLAAGRDAAYANR